jgi:hypothetical protein
MSEVMRQDGMREYNVKDYGAVGDGVILDTKAIQSTIDACAAHNGGTVVVPKGTYLIGTLALRDNVTLYLAADAMLLGSQDIAQYAPGEPGDDYHFRHCLLYARDAKNISLCGKGSVDGQGAAFPCVSRQDSIPAFRGEVKHQSRNGEITQQESRPYVRPMLIIFLNCQYISIRDIEVKNSASWGVHFVACDHIWIDSVRVKNRARPNGDGLDVESCRHVLISNCDIDCDDDAICLKSSIAQRPCENIVVTNCIISSNTAAVKFGTPSRGGFKNIAISNCAFYNCGMGAIKLLSVDGGTLENVTINNIAMQHVEGPLFMRLGNRESRFKIPGFPDDDLHGDTTRTSVLRNVAISNIEATVCAVEVTDPMQRVDVDPKTKQGIFITGIPGHHIENITLSNVHIVFPGGGTLEEANIIVPEDEKMYPEQFFFGKLPAYGAVIRHARGIIFNNVSFELAQVDFRPALLCEDVENLELAEFRAAGNPDTALMRFTDVRDVFIHGCRPLSPVGALIRIKDQDSDMILLKGNDLRKAGTNVIRS